MASLCFETQSTTFSKRQYVLEQSRATPTSHRKKQVGIRKSMSAFAGGVNSPARAFGGVGGHPLFIANAKGQYLVDLDGNRYIDYIGSWGPMILGHAHPEVISAIQKAAELGTSFGAPTERESELAELIINAVPSVDKVRLVSSGTEATMSAIRLARGATGRELVVKFSGNYHGHVDSLLVSAGSAAATLGVPDSPGVTQGVSRDTIVLEYNDLDELQKTFAELGSRIACVILEPVVGNMGLVKPNRWLPAVDANAHRKSRRRADLRRSHDGLSVGIRRSSRIVWNSTGSDHFRKDRGRWTAARSLRRTG